MVTPTSPAYPCGVANELSLSGVHHLVPEHLRHVADVRRGSDSAAVQAGQVRQLVARPAI